MFIRANSIRVGNIIDYEGEPYKVMAMQHITPGKGNAVVQVKFRNIITGVQKENRFRATEDVKKVSLDTQEMQYLYAEGDMHYFMNNETYEQLPIASETLGDDLLFLKENMSIQVQFYEGSIVGIELPQVVELEVVECPPFVKGATVTNQPKPATMDTGVVITVPNFIDVGDVIRVDTSEKKYLERAK